MLLQYYLAFDAPKRKVAFQIFLLWVADRTKHQAQGRYKVGIHTGLYSLNVSYSGVNLLLVVFLNNSDFTLLRKELAGGTGKRAINLKTLDKSRGGHELHLKYDDEKILWKFFELIGTYRIIPWEPRPGVCSSHPHRKGPWR